jgi:hypothetical protein
MADGASEQVKNLIGITISTNYDDILSVVIHQNYKFFERWYIITHVDDVNTINLIRTSNYSNIEILYFDFYKNAVFNKGGAIQFAQKHINLKHEGKNILILDSDIFLPDNFYTIISPLKILADTIYGVMYRYDYGSYHDFIEDLYMEQHSATDIIGYFQLYKQSAFKVYPNSMNCSQCDMVFLHYFKHKLRLPLIIKHLGKASTHWNGRADKRDFSMEL